MSGFASYPSLRNRTVLITGGGSGIGAAMVEQFAMQGARVAFLDIAVDSSVQLVRKLSGCYAWTPAFFACDLTDITALRDAIDKAAAEMGAIRILVNNAARDDRHSLSAVTPAYWDDMMNVNLRHQFFAIQAVAPGMSKAGGGSIINLSSISWMVPSTGFPAYVTAKAAIIGLTRAMAHELGKEAIRVNAVLPGAIATERQRRLWWTPEFEAQLLVNQCVKRTLTPEDVARLVLFLASDDSAAISNQSYVVDGGWM